MASHSIVYFTGYPS